MENPIQQTQVQKAVGALIKHHAVQQQEQRTANKPQDLLQSDEHFWIVIAPHKVSVKTKVAPTPIALKHSILQDAESVCIFTKDPQKEYKEKFAAIGLSHVKVIGISKLREKHKPYEAKRLLCASYETFLADARILPLLPKLLGKSFYAKKKVPGVVDLRKSGDALAQEIQSALMCTSFYMANGACTSTKVGKVEEMTQDQIVENVMAALPQIIKKVPRGWSNIKSIHIKTTSSVALPIYLNADYKEVVPEVKVYEDSTTEVSPEEMTKRADVSFMKRIMQRIGLKV